MKILSKIFKKEKSFSSRNAEASDTGYRAASRRLRSMRSWMPSLGSPTQDYPESDRKTVTARSRDAYRNYPLARAAITRSKSNVIGTGLRLRPEIDWQTLGISKEKASELENIIKRKWKMWASYPAECDAENTLSFYQLQSLALVSSMISGDVFALTPFEQRIGCQYGLKIQMVEADRICNPDPWTKTKQLIDGLEFDKLGAPIACHISRDHPGDSFNFKENKWDRIKIFGKETGRRRILHVWNEKDRPGQTRGVPFLAPIIEPLRKLEEHGQAKLDSAIISTMFTVFMEHDFPEDYDNIKKPWENKKGKVPLAENEIALESCAIVDLPPGEKPTVIDPTKSDDTYDPFFMAFTKQLGAAIEIPQEELLLYYSSSYSAARAAMLQAWKFYKHRRTYISSQFCQPTYELFFDELVARGGIKVEGYNIPERFRAYTGSQWDGPKRDAIDELKEIKAAILRISAGISTLEKETPEMSGEDWETTHAQLKIEKQKRIEDGLEMIE